MEDKGEMSDGYHTFNELYEHRFMLFRALGNIFDGNCWKSKKHGDGNDVYPGWFIAGMETPEPAKRQITYHIPLRLWDKFREEEWKVLEQAPAWDGHTSKDVIERLLEDF